MGCGVEGKKIGYDILIGISKEDQMNDINPVYQLMRRNGTEVIVADKSSPFREDNFHRS